MYEKREFSVDGTANVGKPMVAYRETITMPAEAEGKYIKQSGGRGNYGHTKFVLNQWIYLLMLMIYLKTQNVMITLNL